VDHVGVSGGQSQPADPPMPSFRQPPVVEVVLAVSFEPIEGLGSLQIGQLWAQHFRAAFPKTEEQAPYFPPMERFGRQARFPEVKLEMMGSLPSPRHWFIDETGTQLVQVQHNWFARNWRKMEDHPEYHRYHSIRGPFERDLSTFIDFIHEAGLGVVKPVQCELTYINHIFPGTSWSDHGDLSQIVRVWRDDLARDFLPRPEQVQFAVSYVIPGTATEHQGRLHMSMQPAFTVSGEAPIYVLNLTARGAPLSDDIRGVLGFLDIAHEWVVRGFTSVTSDTMHDVWGRET
jgi:uncharacterized protein (TIGR04255 family)